MAQHARWWAGATVPAVERAPVRVAREVTGSVADVLRKTVWKGLDQRRATLWHRCVSSKAAPKHLLRDAAALHPASTALPCACAVARAHFLASRATAILSAGVAPGSERDSGSEALLSAETAVIAVLQTEFVPAFEVTGPIANRTETVRPAADSAVPPAPQRIISLV
eukprot:COSAG03_NODE_388_length_8306_cov_11.912270_5_plen_167_part_00